MHKWTYYILPLGTSNVKTNDELYIFRFFYASSEKLFYYRKHIFTTFRIVEVTPLSVLLTRDL